MKTAPVDSSTIKAIGYDPDRRELHVDFHKTGRYVYSNVPPEKYQALMSADSIGKHLHENIKGRHQHSKA